MALVNTTANWLVNESTPVVNATSNKSWDDATWILTSAFIIFTMQSGFGLLESGCVSEKNEVNIMAKNVADVVFGGISYWMLGYGLSFGDGSGSNGFCGVGKFFIDPSEADMGEEFSKFVFQSSFATTATTIVSGAVAERMRYIVYIVFSFFNTFVFCFPAHWVWSKHGWLNRMGIVDVAGDGPVHLVGGMTALMGCILIKPRARRFSSEDDHEMGSPTNALLGLFILWWGWLAFNCGSTYGISDNKWKMAARAAATTLQSASCGGVVGFIASYIMNKKKFSIPYIINSILAGLVSITGSCAVTGMWESVAIGAIGAMLCLLSDAVLVRLKIDDPVSVISVHGVAGAWGLLAAGIFAHEDDVANYLADRPGLTESGSFYLLGVQTLAVVSISLWSLTTSGIMLIILEKTMGLRMSPEQEEIGADFIEHNVSRVHLEAMIVDKQNDENGNDNNFDNSLYTAHYSTGGEVLQKDSNDKIYTLAVKSGSTISQISMADVGKKVVISSRNLKSWRSGKGKGKPVSKTQRVSVRPLERRFSESLANGLVGIPGTFTNPTMTTNISSNICMLSIPQSRWRNSLADDKDN